MTKLGVHLFNPEWGYFRDEFLYLTKSARLGALGNMPPFAPVILRIGLAIFGDSVKALHIIPAIFGASTLVISTLIVKRLEGGKWAVLLTGLCVLFAPHYLGVDALFSYDGFDKFFWLLGLYIVITIIKEDRQPLWLVFGLIAGLGMLNKISFAFMGLGTVAGLAISSQRRKIFTQKWIYLGGFIALLIFSPFIINQIRNGWMLLEYAKYYVSVKTYHATIPEFFYQQVLGTHPLALPIWLIGLGALFFKPQWKKYRFLGDAYILLFFLMAFIHVKFYFLTPIYPVLIAAGSVIIESWAKDRKRRKWTAGIFAGLIAVLGVVMIPIAVPVFSVEKQADYFQAAGKIVRIKMENMETGILPQYLADRLGWEDFYAAVKESYLNLQSETTQSLPIISFNYGQAGAIRFFGATDGLPVPLAPQSDYTPIGDLEGVKWNRVLITLPKIADETEVTSFLSDYFETVVITNRSYCEYCVPYTQERLILYCSEPKTDLLTFWQNVWRVD